MATKVQIDVGALPSGVRAVFVQWRVAGREVPWADLGYHGASPFVVEVPYEGDVEIQARALDPVTAAPGDARAATINTRATAPANRPAVADLELPTPTVRQEGPAIEFDAAAPKGQDTSEYEYEVRTSDASTAAADALHVGFAKPDKPILMDAIPGLAQQRVHYRPRRIADDRRGDWQVVALNVEDVTTSDTQDHGGDFAGGAIASYMGIAGLETVLGGGIRHKAMYAGDATGFAGDATDIYAGDAGLYAGRTRYTAAAVDLGTAQDFAIQVGVDPGTVARPTLYAGDQHWTPIPPLEQNDGAYVEHRIFEGATQNGSDETPVVVEVEVAHSTTGSPGSAYEPHVPGKVYRARSYSLRIAVVSWFARRVTLDTLYVRRWCRDRRSGARKPYSFVQTKTAHGFALLDAVAHTTDWAKARADSAQPMPAIGLVVEKTTDTFRVAGPGYVEYASHGLTVDTDYYVSRTTAGALQTGIPATSGDRVQKLLHVVDANTLYVYGNFDPEVVP